MRISPLISCTFTTILHGVLDRAKRQAQVEMTPFTPENQSFLSIQFRLAPACRARTIVDLLLVRLASPARLL
jgi:hypothetical protein